MRPFTTLAAVAAPMDAVNVDTDQIIPARFLKYPRSGGYGGFLFHDLRFGDDGSERPDFVLNQEPFRAAQILVANTNFACGSSREGAVYALADFGIRAVVAPSFGDIFHANCLKNGLLPIRLPAATVAALRAALHAAPGGRIAIDLAQRQLTAPGGSSHDFEIDPHWQRMLLEGLDELGLTLTQLAEIEAFEAGYRAARPWRATLMPGP
ncbi:MAG: 3-isopropylmalate dehydratase small subunit [Alphaproteobacteria bacterium]|nr:3-isopropylmalate dehydratase small subunit [Alphaproteobacteria bacterium]